MTAQTDTRAGAVRPTVTPDAPPLTPAEAHWNAYAAAHGPALRRRARRNLGNGLLGALAVVLVLVLVAGLFALLSPAEQHVFAAVGIMAIVGAFVAVSILVARNARPAPPAPTWDTTPWTDKRPPGTPNTDTAIIVRETHEVLTPQQWRARQAAQAAQE